MSCERNIKAVYISVIQVFNTPNWVYFERVYDLETIITVKDEQNPLFTSNTNIAFNWGGPSDQVETIITILKSRTHNEKVVRKLNYVVDYFVDGRFRKINVYGNSPFLVDIDTFKYQ